MSERETRNPGAEPVRLYRPSNGTEGEGFMAVYCEECERDRLFREGRGEGCEILSRSLIFDIDDEAYPTEWQYRDGRGTCTAFLPSAEPGAAYRPATPDSDVEALGQLNMLLDGAA